MIILNAIWQLFLLILIIILIGELIALTCQIIYSLWEGIVWIYKGFMKYFNKLNNLNETQSRTAE